MIDFRYFSWPACLLIALLLIAAPNAKALDEGKPAPYLEITGIDGRLFKSTDAKGEVIVVNLWATWCSFCREEMPALEAYYLRHKAEGLRMIVVSMDEAEQDAKVREIMQGFSYTGGVGRLSKLKAFGRIWRLPMTFIIDRNGILRKDGSEGVPGIDLASLEREVTPWLKADAAQHRP